MITARTQDDGDTSLVVSAADDILSRFDIDVNLWLY